MVTTPILAQEQPAVNLDALRTDLEHIADAILNIHQARAWLRDVDGADVARFALLNSLEEAHALRLCTEARLSAAEGRTDG